LTNRLKQIVDRVQFERLDRKVLERSDEGDQRQRLGGHATHDIESAEFRHLEIQKRHVGAR
jgi:hypothetical protein